ncbi:MAG: protein kinase [Clostridiales bacterium]|nr:protein kinase [Clostridiales bacterium]
MSDMSNYQSLYHIEKGHELVMDLISHDVRIRKTLRHFDISVYSYLKEHRDPRIPAVIDYSVSEGPEGPLLTVIEEYVQGRTFDSVIEDPLLTDKQKAGLFCEICRGLEFLHGATPAIIHRDIKGSNIMVTDDGHIKIIDYDSSKTYKPGHDRDTVLIGTEGMAAPEQYGFMQSDARTDIYSLGVLMKSAFSEDSPYYCIASKASSFDPDKRYQSALELREAISQIRPSTGKKLFPPPGFRSGNPIKMMIAIFFYSLIIFLSLTARSSGGHVYEDIAYKVSIFLSSLIAIDFFFDWSGGTCRFPLINNEHLSVRIAVRALYALIFFILVTVSLIMIFSGIASLL